MKGMAWVVWVLLFLLFIVTGIVGSVPRVLTEEVVLSGVNQLDFSQLAEYLLEYVPGQGTPLTDAERTGGVWLLVYTDLEGMLEENADGIALSLLAFVREGKPLDYRLDLVPLKEQIARQIRDYDRLLAILERMDPETASQLRGLGIAGQLIFHQGIIREFEAALDSYPDEQDFWALAFMGEPRLQPALNRLRDCYARLLIWSRLLALVVVVTGAGLAAIRGPMGMLQTGGVAWSAGLILTAVAPRAQKLYLLLVTGHGGLVAEFLSLPVFSHAATRAVSAMGVLYLLAGTALVISGLSLLIVGRGKAFLK